MEFSVSYQSDKTLLAKVLGVSEDSLDCGLREVMEEPGQIYGIGKKKSEKIYAIREIARRLMVAEATKNAQYIGGPEDAYSVLASYLRYEPYEQMLIIGLNTKNKVLKIVPVSSGSVCGTVVDTKRIFRELLLMNASAFIMAHNHPSGNASPSSEDRMVAKRVLKAGKIVDIDLLDHIIVGDGEFTSFKEKGLLNNED